MHGGKKFCIGVISNAGRLVRRDIGGVEGAERQHEREASRIGPAALRGMAHDAIGGFGEVLAALDQRGLRERCGNAAGITRMVVREVDLATLGERQRLWAYDQKKRDDADQQQHRKCDQPWKSLGAARGRSCVHALVLLAKRSRSTGRRFSATPVAAKIALRSAGGPAVVPASPRPPGGSPLLIKCTSIFGIWSMRSIR